MVPIFGEASNVSLTVEEEAKLTARLGAENTRTYIERLSLWKAASKKSKDVKSDYFTILNWVRMDIAKNVFVAAMEVKPQSEQDFDRRCECVLRMFQRDMERGLRSSVPSMDEIRQKLKEP